VLQIYNSDYKYNNMNVIVSKMLKYSWLKFIGMPLFTVCVVTHKYKACPSESGTDKFMQRFI